MSLARGLERRLERLVDGVAARLFGGSIHPVELAERLVREADLALAAGPFGPVAPNEYSVTVRGTSADSGALGPLQRELEAVVEDTALERGWRLEGPARVGISPAAGHAPSATVSVSFRSGPRPAWARLLPSAGRAALEVTHNRSVLGRSGGCDLHVAEAEVSRHHALLWCEMGATWITDLGTANGTFVNGDPVDEPIGIAGGDVLAFGPASFVFKAV